MKLYRAYFRNDDDWQILVVAHNSREASGWRGLLLLLLLTSVLRVCVRCE